MENNNNSTEIGRILQKYRKTKKISLEDISDRTHISVETLEMLENGNFDEIPELYLKNFIKRYSTILNLQTHSTIREYLNAENKTGQIPVIRKKRRNSPVALLLKIMIPVLICIICIQLYVLNIQNQRELFRIINGGSGEVIIYDDNRTITLGAEESVNLNANDKVHVINKEKALIMVKYYDDTWEVFFEEFEVQLKDGTD
ncbi:MAG TPA: helix-turn-helix domain-containing protein [Thermotogota bacterium]|nr:helix-turn-helix domain-containing protein [Thermotogota bacterium]HPJ88097.1 helix-turn-helix domain-containing protein [Thermotogota bacterium]HPR96043.1 helix-turn-helix domain-containing protein [Thermotogota bacterium]